MKLRQFIRLVLSFSKGERIGLLVLVFLIVVLMVIKCILPKLVSFTDIDQYAINLEAQEYFSALKDSFTIQIKDVKSDEYHFHQFDPNKCNQSELTDMGLPFYVASNMIKYREKGGEYRYKADLRKIYGMNDSLYRALIKYVEIVPKREEIKMNDSSEEREVRDGKKEELIKRSSTSEADDSLLIKHRKSVVAVVDLNYADTLDLITLNGIGPVYARRIIKYRQLLGGYFCKEQLLEVYGLKMETLKRIVSKVSVDGKAIKKLNLNFASYQQLRKHPYVSEELAKLIIRQRSRKGKFVDLDDFVDRLDIDKEIMKKLKPYVQI